MTQDQIIIFALIGGVFVLLLWGRIRYDLVAFSALVVAVIAGVVPVEEAFSGFGHEATIIIALVLVVSRGLSNAGVIEMISAKVIDKGRSLMTHIGIIGGVAAAMSAIMNNVAALALFMPMDLQAARSSKRSPALTLMPLSFATILGGLVTLIGTPPNIIVASYRQESLGASFEMFDFAPVGGLVAVVGVLFVTLIGWRLIPSSVTEQNTSDELFEIEGYIAELSVGEDSKALEKTLGELEEDAQEEDAQIIGLMRGGERLPGGGRRAKVKEGDVILVEGGPEGIEKIAGKLELDYGDERRGPEFLKSKDLEMAEAVVPVGSRLENRTASAVGLFRRHGVALIGVSRQGRPFRERLARLRIQAGDVILLLGSAERVPETISWLGALPLAERGLQVLKRHWTWIALGLFAAAIGVASAGYIALPIALATVVALYGLLRIVPPTQLYDSIEWPVIVLLGSMIPLGKALEDSGGTALLAQSLVGVAEGFPVAVALTLLMIITMTLSDVINNTATAVIAAPVAVDTAERLGVNPDPFLMAVAVAASCAFLTPIGHKNNTIIMGPGGYRFGDYWRMGLPLEVLVVAVGVPAILFFWPL